MEFKEKVLNMTPSQLVMAMVDGLKNEHCSINMSTFGEVIDGVCFGCAATNAIQEISGLKFTKDDIWYYEDRSRFLNVDWEFLHNLEYAFDGLRCGDIKDANYHLGKINYPYKFPQPPTKLPMLYTHDYKENLQAYINYAEQIKNN